MAKVSKSVREKRKDFSKTKLKVGKSKQLPSNHTDTSFRSKAVVLPKQSITQDAAIKESQTLPHYLALLSHKSGETRKDALQQLTAYLVVNPPRISTTITPLIKAVGPLIIDDTTSVRRTLLDLYSTVFAQIPKQALNSHVELFLLYVSSAMTHISPSIRADSTKYLDWAMKHTNAMNMIVTTQLEKFMKTFSTLFNWAGQPSSISSSKTLSFHLSCFRDLLEAALTIPVVTETPAIEFQAPLKLGQACFISHRITVDLLSPCQSLGLFSGREMQKNADSTPFDLVEPHLSPMLKFLSDRFTDSSNGDRSLCLSILQIIGILYKNDAVKSRKDFQGTLSKVGRAMQVIEETAGQGLTQGLVGEWRSIT